LMTWVAEILHTAPPQLLLADDVVAVDVQAHLLIGPGYGICL